MGPLATAAACAALVLAFAALSWTAVNTKSATWDEPEHLLGGYLHSNHRDFRVNPEDPALFGWITALPLRRDAIKLDLSRESYKAIADNTALQWAFVTDTLYHTGGNDHEKLLRASRGAALAVGIILGAIIAWWAYKLAGPIAAIAATTLFAFDPNFLGHAPLVKNDVMFSTALTGMMFSMWRFGRQGTWLRFAALALCTGAAITVKYSGVLAVPLLLGALLIRAMLRQEWILAGFRLRTRPRRLLGAACVAIAVGLVAYIMVWAVYFFRFEPTPDPRVRLNMDRVVTDAKVNEYLAARAHVEERGGTLPPETEPVTIESIRSRAPSPVIRTVLWLESHRLLPQAWLYGFLYTYKSTLVRSTFLLGEYRATGWGMFFPLAMLFKTPVASLVAMFLALCAAVLWKFDPRPADAPRFRAIDHWSFACLILAPLIYGASAVTTNLNLGLRHILPVYPFIFVGVGVVIAVIWHRWSSAGKIIVGILAAAIVVESALAWPNYIAFFNTPAGGSRGGLKLLGDSNLDWGQDLKLLAKWQRQHPDKKLYLSYFGIADPAAYGIKAIHIPGGWGAQEQWQDPDLNSPAVAAISATNLQGIYFSPELRKAYHDVFLAREPMEVLGGTIYLYPIPLPK